jgi:hypothetical protein
MGYMADLFLRCNFLIPLTVALRFCDGLSASGALRRRLPSGFPSAYKHNGTLKIPAATRLDRPDEEWPPRFPSRCLLSSRKLFRRMLRRAKIDELRTAVGADGLITGKGQLQTYEWALTNFPGDAGRRGAAANRRAGAGGGAAICSGQNSFCESQCGNGPQRERASRGGRYRHQSGAHEPHSRGRFCQSAGCGRARSD